MRIMDTDPKSENEAKNPKIWSNGHIIVSTLNAEELVKIFWEWIVNDQMFRY